MGSDFDETQPVSASMCGPCGNLEIDKCTVLQRMLQKVQVLELSMAAGGGHISTRSFPVCMPVIRRVVQ